MAINAILFANLNFLIQNWIGSQQLSKIKLSLIWIIILVSQLSVFIYIFRCQIINYLTIASPKLILFIFLIIIITSCIICNHEEDRQTITQILKAKVNHYKVPSIKTYSKITKTNVKSFLRKPWKIYMLNYQSRPIPGIKILMDSTTTNKTKK